MGSGIEGDDLRAEPKAPPVAAVAPRPRASPWPTVLGVISIVLGALGILAYGCGSLMANVGVLFVSDAFAAKGALDPVNAASIEALREYLPWNLAVAVVSAGLAAMLLLGGISLCRRRRRGRTILRWWSVLRIAWAVPATFASYFSQAAQFNAMMEAAEASSAPMPGFMFGFMKGAGLAGVAVGLLWAWALPVFMLAWFTRRNIRQEVDGWVSGKPG